jgi:hypothetical protein
MCQIILKIDSQFISKATKVGFKAGNDSVETKLPKCSFNTLIQAAISQRRHPKQGIGRKHYAHINF